MALYDGFGFVKSSIKCICRFMMPLLVVAVAARGKVLEKTMSVRMRDTGQHKYNQFLVRIHYTRLLRLSCHWIFLDSSANALYMCSNVTRFCLLWVFNSFTISAIYVIIELFCSKYSIFDSIFSKQFNFTRSHAELSNKNTLTAASILTHSKLNVQSSCYK